MITLLNVSNYRVLRDLTVQLAPLTIFVGPNGVGKSTALEYMQYLTLLATGVPVQGSEPWNQFPPIDASGYISDGSSKFQITGWIKDRNQPVNSWHINGADLVPGAPATPKLGTTNWPLGFPTTVIRLRLDHKVLHMDSQPNTAKGQVGENGQGLAAALNDLKSGDDPRFDYILDAMKQIVPGLKGIKAPRNPLSAGQFSLICSTGTHNEIPARHMSDGTLYALALITALSTNLGKSTLVLLDDIDQGLHPRAQAELIAQIRKIQERDQNLQVIATCHSPHLVDSLDGNEVILMSADKEGFALAKKLSDHPEYDRLHGSLGSGEFWGSVGEDWVSTQIPPTQGAP